MPTEPDTLPDDTAAADDTGTPGRMDGFDLDAAAELAQTRNVAAIRSSLRQADNALETLAQVQTALRAAVEEINRLRAARDGLVDLFQTAGPDGVKLMAAALQDRDRQADRARAAISAMAHNQAIADQQAARAAAEIRHLKRALSQARRDAGRD